MELGSAVSNGPIHKQDGKASWKELKGDKYMVTGVDRNGKRFRITTDTWQHARMINVYRGSKWLLRGNRRYLIQSVNN